MLHKHHIIPVHAGGTNDPSNVVFLTVEQHAEAHRLLYEQHGRPGDKLAWKALSGQIGKEEIQVEKSRLGQLHFHGRKQSPETIAKRSPKLRGRKRSPESVERIRKSQLGNKNCLGRKLSDETKEKMRQKRLGSKHSLETLEKIRSQKRGPNGRFIL